MDQNLLTPSVFIEKGEKRFSACFSLGYEDYLTFNRFLFQETGLLDQSKRRLRLLGILALGAALIMTVAMLALQLAEPILIFLRMRPSFGRSAGAVLLSLDFSPANGPFGARFLPGIGIYGA